MFALSQLVDIPQIFRRLDALPRELATARQELWSANIQIGEAQRGHDEAQVVALYQVKEDYAKCKNVEQRGHFKTFLFMNDDTVKKAHGYLLAMQEEQAARKANLAGLNDEMSALRKKIDLITALTMGRQETTESVLLRRLLELVRNVPGQAEETTSMADGLHVHASERVLTGGNEAALKAEPPPDDLQAGDPFPF